jgi:hypothetical protein
MTHLQMLDSQDNRIDRSQTGISNDQHPQSQLLYEIIQDNMLLFIPAQRTDDPAAASNQRFRKDLFAS